MPQNINDKKIVMIIASSGFKDREYFVTKNVLEEAGIRVVTASNQLGIAHGTDGGKAAVDISLNELRVADYQGIIFVGGPGCLQNLDNEKSYQIAQEAVKQNKILAAICISPSILAKAGVLVGKRATVWSNESDQSAIQVLQKHQAVYQPKAVVADGRIITSNGPMAAEEFGQAIIRVLTELTE